MQVGASISDKAGFIIFNMKKLLIALLLFPFPVFAEVPSGVLGFGDGKFYDENQSLKYLCFTDNNCYDLNQHFAFKRGSIAGVSLLSPEQQAAENLKKLEESYLAQQEKKRIANLPIQKPDVPVAPAEPVVQEPPMAKDVGEIKCSYNYPGEYNVTLTCINSYDFTEGEIVRLYGSIPASDFSLGSYKTTFANKFIGPLPIGKLCEAKQTCIYSLYFDNTSENAYFSSYYIKLPGEPLEKKAF